MINTAPLAGICNYEYSEDISPSGNSAAGEDLQIRKDEGHNGVDKLYKEMIANRTKFKNSQCMIADTLGIVCHSMGYAYALGMIVSLMARLYESC